MANNNNNNNNIVPAVPQPRPVNQNRIQTLWTDEQCLYLLNQRMAKNDEYWALNSRNRKGYWRSIALEINECFGTRFTYGQVKQKWKNLLRDYLVSQYILLIDILYVYTLTYLILFRIK